jgi:hypothetical protein
MTRTEVAARYTRLHAESHGELLASVRELVEQVADDPGDFTLGSWPSEIARAMVVAPAKTMNECAAVRPALETALAHRQHRGSGAMGRVEMAAMGLANVLICGGIGLSDASVATISAWVSQIAAKRDDEKTTTYWNKAFAALALGDRRTYLGFCDQPLVLKAGATHEYNLRAFVTMLAAAIEQRAPAAAVRPAYEEVLENYTTFLSASTLDALSLFWIARIVHHDLGHVPLSQVASKLHDDIYR